MHPKDIDMANRLARIGDVDLDDISNAIFNAASASERTVEELLFTDYKDFHIAGYTIGIGQVTSRFQKCIKTQRNWLHLWKKPWKKSLWI